MEVWPVARSMLQRSSLFSGRGQSCARCSCLSWKARWEQLQNVCSWRKLSRDHLFFSRSPGSSQPGQTEAAMRHFHGNMCLDYCNLWKAVFILSTASVYQLDLSQAAVKQSMHFTGGKIKILGNSRQCQENLWLVEYNFTSNSSCRDCFFFFDCWQKH